MIISAITWADVLMGAAALLLVVVLVLACRPSARTWE